MPNYQEQNAKAEQMGAGIALGCGVIVLLFILFILVAAFLA